MRLLFILSVCVLLLAGCSSANSPVTSENDSSATELSYLPLLDLTEAGEASNATGLLGAFDLTIDPETLAVSLENKRIASEVGDSYLIEGMAYFTVFPCVDCLRLDGLSLTQEGAIQLTFILRHPFEMPPSPCTAPSRIDLSIFDLTLLVHPREGTPVNWLLTNNSAYAGACSEADGYSRELESLINDPAALPYFLVIDDNESATNTFNIFQQGAFAAFDINLNPAPALVFSLYLTFGYGASATKPTRCDPSYFNPEFNRKSAWKVQVHPPDPGLEGTWDDVDNVTTYDVEIQVWDWQQNAAIADPPVNPTDVRYLSNVASVSAEIPGMTNTLPRETIPVSGTGNDPADPLIYQIPIANENLLAIGDYLGLVKVIDERIPPLNPFEGDVDSLIYTPNGIELNWMAVNNGEFATYQTFTATVVEGVSSPKNILLRDSREALDIAVDHADGDLYILYDDGEIWKRTAAGEYMTGTKLMDEPGIGFEYIDIATNSYMVVADYTGTTRDNGLFFRPDDTFLTNFDYGGLNPACYAQDAIAFTGSGVLGNYLGVATNGCWQGTYAKWVIFPPTTYSYFITPSPYKEVGCGIDSIGYRSSQQQGAASKEIIRAAETFSGTTDYVYYLESETTSYFCEEFRVQRFSMSGSSLVPDLWWGGTQSNDGTLGFWDPKDITRDSSNDFYILDILSTGAPRVKKYQSDGTYIGEFGDVDTIEGSPLRIEGSDYVGPNGSAIFVLSEDTPADKLSIFLPIEMP